MLARQIYIAPKPNETRTEVIQNIATWIFPPTALWKASKLGINKLIGQKIGKLLIPAQHNQVLTDEASELYKTFLMKLERSVVLRRMTVRTYDNASIDTVEISVESNNIHVDDRPYIIKFGGNGGCFERGLNSMLGNAIKLGAVMVGFNYRGVCQSDNSTNSKTDSLVDGIAQVQRLLDQGVKPINIFLHGNSYGAGIVALVGEYFHHRGIAINIAPMRAFSSLTNAIVGLICKGEFSQNKKETMNLKILSKMAKPLIKFVLTITDWEVDTASAYKKIPEKNKEYSVVRSRKEIRSGRKDDGTVPYDMSLHAALRSTRKQMKDNFIKKQGSIPEQFKQYNKARKFEALAPDIDGHLVPEEELTNRYGVNGMQFFQQFVNKTLLLNREAVLSDAATLQHSITHKS